MLTGVMFAMPEEGAALIAELAVGSGSGTQRVEHGRRVFHFGSLWGADVVLVGARVGKVAAATTATELVTRFGVDRLVMTGLAGGVGEGVRIGDLVVADRLAQHDLDASPLFPPMEVPLLGVRELPTDPDLTRSLIGAARGVAAEGYAADLGEDEAALLHARDPSAHVGLIVSGDRFVSTDAERDALRARAPGALCVEMEGAAAAQVAFEYAVPFGAVRVISDAADDHAASRFPEALGRLAAAGTHGVLERLFRKERAR